MVFTGRLGVIPGPNPSIGTLSRKSKSREGASEGRNWRQRGDFHSLETIRDVTPSTQFVGAVLFVLAAVTAALDDKGFWSLDLHFPGEFGLCSGEFWLE